MSATVLIPVVLVAVLGFTYLFPSLTGWRTLARSWNATRLHDKMSVFARETEIDWMYGYPWIEVRITKQGIHCQQPRFSARGFFHAPILVPWSAVTEVIERPDSIEVRAQVHDIAFRVEYPVALGIPEEIRPSKAPEPAITSVTPPAGAGVAPVAGVAQF